ncbi:recombinase family protein [Streptomyces flaveus]|uniref:Recombinase domain-containing protein n=1 Tax=Streptomyces flaveus TaxID=66370 RepID=A0A917RFA0_9ACTN|nr:recombinase family protein [Streptomyces flaveus]GGL05453.1 hypothetical protein GCM10010094_77790 [Streptomyces flaveus]
MGGPEAIRAWIERGSSTRRGGPASGTGSPLIRVAWLGRTSTRDLQDPTLSLPRQLRNSRAALPENTAIVAHFYDVESGRLALDARGHGTAHEKFQIPIPRDGSIQDLLEEAQRPDRRFDAVICEAIDRIARTTYFSTRIEYQLEQAGVPLLAADEPIRLDVSPRKAKAATQVLTRRMKQGVAEWYVTEMLEKSWSGFEMHTEQGYNIGKPCYGYQARPVPHPVPAKRAKGVKKTLLEVHPVEGPVVRKMFHWRIVERLSYQAIADRLNADLTLNPPPSPILADTAVGHWTYSSARDVLTNPKHTGHMVWNRRARKGAGRNRPNPVEEWVWSIEPTHEALVDLETFVQAQQVAEHRERSRSAAGTSRHPQAQRTYRLRSFIFCAQCERRFYGKPSKGINYYVCAPKKPYRAADHPASVWVPEAGMLEGLGDFLSDRVFGVYRRELLTETMDQMDAGAEREREARAASLRRAIAEAETKSKRLLHSLELVDNPDRNFIRDLNERRAELHGQQMDLERQLSRLETEIQETPNPDLLTGLPVTAVDLTALPDALSRRLFETLRLEIHYDHKTELATCRVTLTSGSIGDIADMAEVLPGRPGGTTLRTSEEEGMAAERKTPPPTFCGAPPAGATKHSWSFPRR